MDAQRLARRLRTAELNLRRAQQQHDGTRLAVARYALARAEQDQCARVSVRNARHSSRAMDAADTVEPKVIDCADLERLGAWHTCDCCKLCHGGNCRSMNVALDIGGHGQAGQCRLLLCCKAGMGNTMSAEDLDRL